MMEVMGDKMMDKILKEVNTVLESTFVGFAGVETNKDEVKETSESSKKSSEVNVNKVKKTINHVNEVKKKDDRWDLIGSYNEKVSDVSLYDLGVKRNSLWDKIFEARKTLEQYRKELIACEQRLFLLKQSEENKMKIQGLELQWRSLEATLRSMNAYIAKLESQAKSVTRRILFLKNRLKVKSSKEIQSNVEDKKDVINTVTESKKSIEVEHEPENLPEDDKWPTVLEIESDTTSELNGHDTATEESASEVNRHELLDDNFVEYLGGNIKISINKVATAKNPGDEFDKAQSEKMVAKMEGMVKQKLAKHDLTKSGKVIKVKFITTRLPEGMEDAEDWQVQGMFYNMMTGNVEGYEDIESVRRDEENYGFSWSEEVLEEIERKIKSLREDGNNELVDEMVDFALSRDEDEDIFNFRKKPKEIETSSPRNEKVKKLASKIVNDVVESEEHVKSQDKSLKKEEL